MRRTHLPAAVLLSIVASIPVWADTLTVGPGQRFAQPAEALKSAKAGDTIQIHPGGEYTGVALLVRVPHLTIRGADADRPSVLQGQGFDYSGVGSVPRAIIQVDPAGAGCVIENLDLSGAHNSSHNGSGIRINQANAVTVRSCLIHNNDMGIMSSGDSAGHGAKDQRIESCHIHHNGAPSDPGYSHNLYLGGESVILSACEIDSSTAGHNLKSRARITVVEACWIHDSANREIDLVDAEHVTDTPGSNALLAGNIIVKAKDCAGNRSVINFGKDGKAEHNGVIHLVNNTIITPYVAPVVDLSSDGARARFENNLIIDNGANQRRQRLVSWRDTGASDKPRVTGASNVVSEGFDDADLIGLAAASQGHGRLSKSPQFANPANGDFRFVPALVPEIGHGVPISTTSLPNFGPPSGKVLRWYTHPRHALPRDDAAAPAIGAQPAS